MVKLYGAIGSVIRRLNLMFNSSKITSGKSEEEIKDIIVKRARAYALV